MKRNLLVSMAVVLALGFGAISIVNAQTFSDWSAPANLGPAINTNYVESCVSVSKNGLSLYFSSSRPPENGVNWDLWVVQRASFEDEWGIPQWLGPNINSTYSESCPALSLDEHRLYFVSTRPGGCGGGDLYVSRRHDRRDDFGWEPAENLGCIPDGYVNSSANEATAAFFEDETGTLIMYFAKAGDIYASAMRDDDTFGPPEIVAELSIPVYSENGATIRRDGLEVIFSSNRPGGSGGLDLWMSTRDSTSEPWSAPVNLAVLNSPLTDGGRMSLSFDGRTLYFTSDRPGGFGSRDLYVTTRSKLGKE
jgi:hypothetical protein